MTNYKSLSQKKTIIFPHHSNFSVTFNFLVQLRKWERRRKITFNLSNELNDFVQIWLKKSIIKSIIDRSIENYEKMHTKYDKFYWWRCWFNLDTPTSSFIISEIISNFHSYASLFTISSIKSSENSLTRPPHLSQVEL